MHQADLDMFLSTQRLPDTLKRYLTRLDRGHMPGYNGDDTYTEVIQVAARHGLRIRALDCTASYHVKGLRDTVQSRNQMFSYFASQVIKADQAAHGPHKWLAFIGSAHTNINLGCPAWRSCKAPSACKSGTRPRHWRRTFAPAPGRRLPKA